MVFVAGQYDVLIVGCGPTGATLANLLRLGGHRVAIFDRSAEVFPVPRAMVIDDESQRILRCMGVLERLFPDDIAPFNTHRFVDNQRRVLAGLDTKVAETHDISMGAIFHQPALEELLRSDFARGSGVDAFLGHDVTSVDWDDHGVQLAATDMATGAECHYRASYLVGCDGGSSMVRRAMDVQRVDFNYAKTWMVMDTVVEDAAFFAALPEGSEFLCDYGRAAVFVKGRRNFVRFDFEVTAQEQENYSNAHAVEHISRYYDPKFFEVVRLGAWVGNTPVGVLG